VALHPKHTLIDAEQMERWKRHVPRVHTWTVNDPERARELARLGVDCLISDNPGLLRSALEAAAGTAHDNPSGGRLAE
jgi:glycerophosphoryl diester phosphodiesterase